MAAGIDDLVRATPASRDRYVDFLRAASILSVVIGHWTIALLFWDGGVIRSTSAIGKAPGLWMATWLFQVMPVFFFVGGYSNLVAYQSARRRGDSAITFIRSRVRRLLVPSLVLMGVWAGVQVVLHLTDTGGPTGPRFGDLVLLRGVRPPGQTIPFGPLWFLAVYLVVVCISPLTVALHRRLRWWVPAVMVAGTIVVDAVGFVGGHGGVRYLNAAFVFLLPHQLDRLPRRHPLAVAARLRPRARAHRPVVARAPGVDRRPGPPARRARRRLRPVRNTSSSPPRVTFSITSSTEFVLCRRPGPVVS